MAFSWKFSEHSGHVYSLSQNLEFTSRFLKFFLLVFFYFFLMITVQSYISLFSHIFLFFFCYSFNRFPDRYLLLIVVELED